jgi:ribosomal 50S subunit-associated protein YjgA (DUF615 family)
MSMLLEDLAEETTAGNRRLADRLDAEARELEELRRVMAVLEELRQQVVESARQATEYVLSRFPQAEGVWHLATSALRKESAKESQERLLSRLLGLFESGQRLLRRPRVLWEIAEQLGAPPERLEDLGAVEKWFEKVAAETKRALEHRAHDWQPSDPDRLALGLRLAREGRTVKAEAARARFRRPQG